MGQPLHSAAGCRAALAQAGRRTQPRQAQHARPRRRLALRQSQRPHAYSACPVMEATRVCAACMPAAYQRGLPGRSNVAARSPAHWALRAAAACWRPQRCACAGPAARPAVRLWQPALAPAAPPRGLRCRRDAAPLRRPPPLGPQPLATVRGQAAQRGSDAAALRQRPCRGRCPWPPSQRLQACRRAWVFRGYTCDVDRPETVSQHCMLHSMSSKKKFQSEAHRRRLGGCACASAAGVAGVRGLLGSRRSAAALALRAARGSGALRRNT